MSRRARKLHVGKWNAIPEVPKASVGEGARAFDDVDELFVCVIPLHADVRTVYAVLLQNGSDRLEVKVRRLHCAAERNPCNTHNLCMLFPVTITAWLSLAI